MKNSNTIFDHKFILLVGDHYNPLGLLRSLGEFGIKPDVILISKQPHLVNKSKYCKKVLIFDSVERGYDYLIANYSSCEFTPFVLTGSDDIVSYLDMRYDEIKDKFHFYNGGEQGRITRLMSKAELMKLAIECDIDVPRTELLPVGELPKNLRYPVFTKAIDSITQDWKANVNICQTPEELAESYKHLHVNNILVQEFIEKDNELCLDGISLNGGEEVYIPLQSLYYRLSSYSYGYYFYFEKFSYPELLKKIKTLFKKTRFTGIFSIEFLLAKDGTQKFLEINFRHSAWGYANTKCGFNLPVIYAQSVLAGHIDTSSVKDLGKYPFKALVEFADFRSSVIEGKVSLWQWINEIRTCDCFFYWNMNDKKPFWSEMGEMLKRKRKRILKF